jgi:hypothetical protein
MSTNNEFENIPDEATPTSRGVSDAISIEATNQFSLPESFSRCSRQTNFQLPNLLLEAQQLTTADASTSSDKAAPPAVSPGQQAVKDLNHEDFESRERAQSDLARELRDNPEQTLPLLARELVSPAGPESRRRTERLLSSYISTVATVQNQANAVRDFIDVKTGNPFEVAALDAQRQRIIQGSADALSPDVQRRLNQYSQALEAAAASLGLANVPERLRSARAAQAQVVPLRIDHAMRLYREGGDPLSPEVRAEVGAQLAQALRDKPTLANEIPGDDKHNQSRYMVFKYAALAGAGRHPLFVSALLNAGGSSALGNFQDFETGLLNRQGNK